MLTVNYSVLANSLLYKVADYLDSINTFGSGERWLISFHEKVKKYAQPIKYALCRHEIYAASGFSCVAIDNWIVIFKIENNQFNVYQIVLASSLY